MILCHLHALNYHVWELTYIELIVYEKKLYFHMFVCVSLSKLKIIKRGA